MLAAFNRFFQGGQPRKQKSDLAGATAPSQVASFKTVESPSSLPAKRYEHSAGNELGRFKHEGYPNKALPSSEITTRTAFGKMRATKGVLLFGTSPSY